MTQTLHDQADELRQLVLRTAIRDRGADAPAAPIVAVAGGKGGVGATTVAVNVAVALARQGRRAVLVDADFHQPDATALCRLRESGTVADVLDGRRTVHEILQRGPAGIQVLPGAWGARAVTECGPLAQQRLVAELRRLGPHADVIVLDAGSSSNAVAARFWQAADLAVFVTTDEPAAIMGCYAAIKLLTAGRYGGHIRVLVNKTTTAERAGDVAARIDQACQKFLALSIDTATHLPYDPAVADAAQRERPVVPHAPSSDAARAVERLADQLQTILATARPGRQTNQAA
jgi:flagellar biosynthesis protein FlhG